MDIQEDEQEFKSQQMRHVVKVVAHGRVGRSNIVSPEMARPLCPKLLPTAHNTRFKSSLAAVMRDHQSLAATPPHSTPLACKSCAYGDH